MHDFARREKRWCLLVLLSIASACVMGAFEPRAASLQITLASSHPAHRASADWQDGAPRIELPAGVADAQLALATPLRLAGSFAPLLNGLCRSLLVAGLLWLAWRVTMAPGISDQQLVVGAALAPAGLIVALALLSATPESQHPDESSHVAALQYFLAHGLAPPAVTDPAVVPSLSVWGYSYLFELDIAYPLTAFVLAPLGLDATAPLPLARLFNVALLALVAACALRCRAWAAVAAVALVSPQILYIFAYFNADALPFVLALVTVALASGEERGVAGYLRDGERRYGPLIAFVLCAGLLLICKRNYIPVVPVVGMWLAVRHIGLRLVDVLLVLAGFFLLGTAAFFRAPMFGAPLEGGTGLLVGGIVVGGIGAGMLSYRLWLDPALRRPFVRLLLLAGLCVAVALPRVAWDRWQNGSPSTKHAAIKAIAQEYAGPDFKPSALGGPARHGYSVWQVFESPDWHWAAASLESAFGVYGYMAVPTPSWLWRPLLVNFGLLVASGFVVLRRQLRSQWLALTAVVTGGAMLVAWSSLLHSWINAFQPQGRYLFPAFVLMALPLGAAGEKQSRSFRLFVLAGGAMSFLSLSWFALRAFIGPVR